MVKPYTHTAGFRRVGSVDVTVSGNVLVGEASQTALILAPVLESVAVLPRVEVMLLKGLDSTW